MTIAAVLSETPFNPVKSERSFLSKQSGHGAVVTFKGVMRPISKTGQEVATLHLDWHPALTLKSIEEILKDADERFDVTGLFAEHRCGSVYPGETIVLVCVASLHRREAFQAADYVMDRLKTDAVFWKREIDTTGAENWIDTTSRDSDDRMRWDK